MQLWGKLLGVVLGVLVGGPIGAFFGLLIGHQVDKRLAAQSYLQGYFSNQQARQSLFFQATFSTMGHLTKSKGRVTEADIHMANAMMDRMNLHGEARRAAQEAFRAGKSADFALRQTLRDFRRACFGRFDLLQMFMEIQLQTAFADGSLHPSEREVLYVIAEELGFSRHQFEQLLSMLEGSTQFRGHQQSHQEGWSPRSATRGPTVEDACKVLGVPADADNQTIKRAYRKLMNEHHPDKLVAKGLPPEMMELAKQKAQDIQAAYDLLRRERGFR
ncbi:co-chaperone DjlA [Plesiomonas shigelloides]|uniref:co-chaperone DjlA n=1 Tax=Plesiomonas shigelloides TaxID=703 RepID=UPI0031394673